jgi:hypothetical protein
VNSGALQFVSIINEHKETRQTGCAHESTDLCLYAERDDLQAGKGRSLQDAKEKEIVQGKRRRLKFLSFEFKKPGWWSLIALTHLRQFEKLDRWR